MKRAFSKTKKLSSKRVNFTRAKERDRDGDRETYKLYKAQRSRSISTQLTFDDWSLTKNKLKWAPSWIAWVKLGAVNKGSLPQQQKKADTIRKQKGCETLTLFVTWPDPHSKSIALFFLHNFHQIRVPPICEWSPPPQLPSSSTTRSGDSRTFYTWSILWIHKIIIFDMEQETWRRRWWWHLPDSAPSPGLLCVLAHRMSLVWTA